MHHLPLSNRLIALPESRQLDILAALLEKRGAKILRCPLVAILDAPDPEPIQQWLANAIAEPFDDFIVLTGEGIRRLVKVAEKARIKPELIAALDHMRIIARGPKPGQALKPLGLKPTIITEIPTTDGVIATLEQLSLRDRRVAVQLYGTDPNQKLIDYLQPNVAQLVTVAPYVYASDSEDQQVLALIDALAANQVDAIAFTSQPQCRRLFAVAKTYDREHMLREGLANTVVAAIGPVMAAALQAKQVRVDLMPENQYFMKPMVSKLVELLNA